MWKTFPFIFLCEQFFSFFFSSTIFEYTVSHGWLNARCMKSDWGDMSWQLWNIPIIVWIAFLFARFVWNNCDEDGGQWGCWHCLTVLRLHYETFIYLSLDERMPVKISLMFFQILLGFVVTHETRTKTFAALSLAHNTVARLTFLLETTKRTFPRVSITTAHIYSQSLLVGHNGTRGMVDWYLHPAAFRCDQQQQQCATTKANACDTFLANFVRNFTRRILAPSSRAM